MAIKFLAGLTNESYTKTALKDKISYKEKTQNDYAWVKTKIDFYDRYDLPDDDSLKNYKLYNGIYDTKDYEKVVNTFGYTTDLRPADFKYIDILSAPLKELEGEHSYRHFEPIVVAVNPEASNQRLKVKAQMLNEYMMSRIEQKENNTTPEQIENYVKHTLKLPEEKQAQQFLNWLLKKLNLKFKFNKGFKDLLIGSKVIFLPRVINGEIELELINPAYFKSYSVDDSEFIEDSEACVYVKFRTLSDVITEYDLKEDEINRLDLGNFSNIPLRNELVLLNSSEVLFDGTERTIRVAYVTFATLKKIKFITRITEQGIEELIVDETYKFNPMLDISEEETWIKEIWGGTKIGTNIYKDMGPIDYQYTNLTNPYNAKQPFYGAVFENRNAEPVSLMDRGKNWAFMFNYFMYQLEQLLGLDIGNIMLATMDTLPKDWTPEKWFSFIKATKIAFINPNKEGMGSDPQYWKSLNMSNATDVSYFIQLLTYCEKQCYKAMGMNENRLGTAGVSETVTNNAVKIQQSSNITEGLYYLFDRVKENVCTRLIELCKMNYTETDKVLTYVLDDMSLSMLSLNTENMSLSEFGCFVTTNIEDYNVVNQLRQYLNSFILNGDGDLRIVIKALRTKNPAAIEELVNTKYDELQKQKQAEQELQKELIDKQLKAAADEKELDRAHELRLALIKAMGYLNDADVDKNQVPDILEIEKFNKEFELKKDELKLREKELIDNNKSEAADREIEREKLQLLAKQKKVTNQK